MPLNLAKLAQLLNEKKAILHQLSQLIEQEFHALQSSAGNILFKPYSELMAMFTSTSDPTGAIPSIEFEHGLFQPSKWTLSDLQSMMNIAQDLLHNRVIAGVDGSQIYTSTDFSLPIGVIQVVLFANYHLIPSKYQKIPSIALLLPSESETGHPEIQKNILSHEFVDTQRFCKEIEILEEFMHNLVIPEADRKKSLMLIDGTLVLSFLSQFLPEFQKMHFDSLTKLFTTSQRSCIPIIGYIDGSAAKDVISMLCYLTDQLPETYGNISDAHFLEACYLNQYGTQMNFGDRTCTFICHRNDTVYLRYPQVDLPSIAFFYIKLHSEYLVRVEFPVWCVGDAGILQLITENIIAESIIGLGYPYALDQAHHATIIQNQDRERFYRLFQEFCEREKIPNRLRMKGRSKLRRLF